MRILKLIFLVALFLVINLHQTVQAKQFKALLFTKTDGWHHQAINEGVTALKKLAIAHHFDMAWHEDATQFNDENLSQYDVIIFLLTTGDILNDKQQIAMEKFIQSGKGFVGIHSAADTEYQWPWYQKLVGHNFVIHPEIQTAKLTVESRNFPGLELMPKTFFWTEEWYQYSDAHVENLSYILSVDEKTYQPTADWGSVKGHGMGSFHPIAWYHYYQGGRSFYTGLGHIGANYENALFLSHLYGGIYWAATGLGIAPDKN